MVFGFFGQFDELENMLDICVLVQIIFIYCLFDNCIIVWDIVFCFIYRIDFLIIVCNVFVDFFYLEMCFILFWCSICSLIFCIIERYCFNIYMYMSLNQLLEENIFYLFQYYFLFFLLELDNRYIRM